MEISFCFDHNSNTVVNIHFSIWYNSNAAIVYAKFCDDLVDTNRIIINPMSHRIWIGSQKRLVKQTHRWLYWLFPSLLTHCCLGNTIIHPWFTSMIQAWFGDMVSRWRGTTQVPSHWLSQWWLISMWIPRNIILTHCGLVTPYGDMDFGSTLAQVMTCCLMAPSHYLNQCWLIISEVQWHSY